MYLLERIEGYKYPKSIVLTKEFLKLSTGKILKTYLRRLYVRYFDRHSI